MGSEDKLKQFKLEGVVQVYPDEAENYEFGHGSYGYVVEMRYQGLQCAGKKFYRDLYCHGNVEERERIIARCYDECLLLCSLSHPNIVQFLGITLERSNSLPILVMEFVPFTLSSYLNEHGIFPKEISLGILKDVATGLCYLHGGKRTIIHRDLSANNILLTWEMRAKIADLGMSKIINATPAKSKCPGTAAYMPPEALVEKPEYRTEIDRFSYGVLTIHVLCGQWPHPGNAKECESDGKLVAHSEYERRRKYISILGDNHPMLQLIHQCLSDDPSKRPIAETILSYVQRVASKCPRQFENILSLLKKLDSVSYELKWTQNEQRKLKTVNGEAELRYDILHSQLEQSESEHAILKKKLEQEREIGSIQKCKLDAKIKEEEKAHLNDLARLRDMSRLLDQQNDEIIAFNERIEAQAKEIEATRCELELKEQRLQLVKEQMSSMNAELHMKAEDICAALKAMNEMHATPSQIKETSSNPIEEASQVQIQIELSELKTSSRETERKEEQLKLNQAQIAAMESQIKSNDEEKRAISERLQSQLNNLQRQVDSLKQQNETKKRIIDKMMKERDNLKEKFDEVRVVSRTKEILENAKLELDVLKKCEIPVLKEELELKESYTEKLTCQLQRAQKFLHDKEGPFLKLKFKPCDNLPMAMSDAQCAVIEDRIYVGGGTGEDKSTHTDQSQVFEYSLIDKKWRLLCHNQVRFFGLTNFLGKLVSVGGIISSNYITDKIAVFNFAQGCWDGDKIKSMPTKRFYPTVISHGKHLAVCGGITHGGSTTNVVEVLVNNEQWCRGPNLPYRICRAKPTLIDHSCYLIGGDVSEGRSSVPSKALISIPLAFLFSARSEPEAYKSWEGHTRYPYGDLSSDYYPAIANLGGIMLVIGGWNHKKMAPTNNVFAYSSEATTLVRVESLPIACCSLAATAQLQNGAVMLIGGVEKLEDNNNKKSCRVLLASLRL